MPIYMDEVGRLYNALTPASSTHASKPFVSSALPYLLEGEAPQTVDNLTGILTAHREDSTTIPRLKALSNAARKQKEKDSGNEVS